jgi:3-oxoacyl-(acyl-carrier-protein) synthase
MQKKRIVITGMGIISLLGETKEDYIANLLNGKSGIRTIESFDTSMIECKIGGDMGNYDYKSKMQSYKEKIPEDTYKRMRKILKTSPPATRLTIFPALDAFLDAGLKDYKLNPDRICCILGGHNFHDGYSIKNAYQFLEEPEYIDGLMGVVVYDTDMAACICDILQIKGPLYTVGGTCTSAGIALRNAIREIRCGDCDIAVTGGGSLDYSALSFQALSMVNAISYKSFNDKPEKASRPFDADREGFVPSQGSGILIIEDLDHAKSRGAHIYAEVLAVESNNDGNHLSIPSVEGQAKVMTKAIKNAGITPQQIDYINAHATSTPIGDTTEIKSIKNVFGEHAYKLKINATKSMLGHTGWTSHSIELIASIMQMHKSMLHPSINIDNLDNEIDLDICANSSCEYNIDYLLKNSFGFGGINCCTILKKFINN